MATKKTTATAEEIGATTAEAAPTKATRAKKVAPLEDSGTVQMATAKDVPQPVKAINLPRLEIQTINVTVVGDSELICHAWSEKAKREMLGRHIGVASLGREKKVPTDDFLQSLYTIKPGKMHYDAADRLLHKRCDDGHPDVHITGGVFGFPSVAFKAAMVEACTSTGKAITKVQARQAFHINGEFTKIIGQPRMREDMVRLNGQTADIRYRGGFKEWSAVLSIRYNTRVLTAEQIVNLLNIAGFSVGVGEWRSERDGGFGLFHVASGNEGEAGAVGATTSPRCPRDGATAE